jgi:hypothetical protein
MGLFDFVENFFFISLAITVVLIMLLIFHFKQRISIIETKHEELVNGMKQIMGIINVLAKQSIYSGQYGGGGGAHPTIAENAENGHTSPTLENKQYYKNSGSGPSPISVATVASATGGIGATAADILENRLMSSNETSVPLWKKDVYYEKVVVSDNEDSDEDSESDDEYSETGSVRSSNNGNNSDENGDESGNESGDESDEESCEDVIRRKHENMEYDKPFDIIEEIQEIMQSTELDHGEGQHNDLGNYFKNLQEPDHLDILAAHSALSIPLSLDETVFLEEFGGGHHMATVVNISFGDYRNTQKIDSNVEYNDDRVVLLDENGEDVHVENVDAENVPLANMGMNMGTNMQQNIENIHLENEEENVVGKNNSGNANDKVDVKMDKDEDMRVYTLSSFSVDALNVVKGGNEDDNGSVIGKKNDDEKQVDEKQVDLDKIKEYKKLSLSQLKTMLITKGVHVDTSKMKKADIVQLLSSSHSE